MLNKNSDSKKDNSPSVWGTFKETVSSVKNFFTNTDISDIFEIIADYCSDLIKRESTKIYYGQIIENKGQNLYDIKILSGERTDDSTKSIIHNIRNNTIYDYSPGDYVQVCVSGNNLSMGFIINSLNPPSIINSTIIDTLKTSINNDLTPSCYLQYTSGHWFLIFSPTFYYTVLQPLKKTMNNKIKIRVGISRKLSKKNGAAKITPNTTPNTSRELYWYKNSNKKFVMKESRRYYSLPEYIGSSPNQGVRTAKNFEIDEILCTSSPTPIVDITDIVNNSIFIDDYVYRHSCRKDLNNLTEENFWFKQFGIFVLAVTETKAYPLYLDFENSLYTVKVYTQYDNEENKYKLCSSREYNLQNLIINSSTKEIKLRGDITSNYQVDPADVINLLKLRVNYLVQPTNPGESLIFNVNDEEEGENKSPYKVIKS